VARGTARPSCGCLLALQHGQDEVPAVMHESLPSSVTTQVGNEGGDDGDDGSVTINHRETRRICLTTHAIMLTHAPLPCCIISTIEPKQSELKISSSDA
jgi:hypothetical protein